MFSVVLASPDWGAGGISPLLALACTMALAFSVALHLSIRSCWQRKSGFLCWMSGIAFSIASGFACLVVFCCAGPVVITEDRIWLLVLIGPLIGFFGGGLFRLLSQE